MKILLVLSSENPEVQWNAVRFGNVLLNEGEDVDIFLNGPAVALSRNDSVAFPIKEQCRVFCLSEGGLHA